MSYYYEFGATHGNKFKEICNTQLDKLIYEINKNINDMDFENTDLAHEYLNHCAIMINRIQTARDEINSLYFDELL